ncbi:MAG TPA: ArsR family transcriptional regulator [candidate division WOR-3 bacterium]|uniref:ArsR family transcriptional regulator n=1 Tax=candidate division WOR-3 bacterium TaxID=2052148 RepID=A0A7C5HG15_UNCW3|nr:ArsR family transcriptional regulator [candidate division WOR-3 bacterium]
MKLTLRGKAKIFKALSEERRLEILRYLSDREFCVGDVAQKFNMSASVASHHLKTLENVGLVLRRKEGKNVIFKVNIELLKKLFEDIFVFLGIERKLIKF